MSPTLTGLVDAVATDPAVVEAVRRARLTGTAQVRQRATGCANWLTQASHTGSLGQAWQTAQRLGRVGKSRAMRAGNTVSIYSRHTSPEP